MMKKHLLLLLIGVIISGTVYSHTDMTTAVSPLIVNVGTKSSNFTYTHTQNTQNTPNAYVGRPANDVYYKLILSTTMDIVISHCGSEVADTYVHLLDASYNRLAYNDDYTGTGACSNTRHSYLKMTKLTAGTYYVVSEGYSANGNITTTIKGTLPEPFIINVPPAPIGQTYTHTQDTRNTVNAFVGRSTNDVYYKFQVYQNMDLEISHCGSEVNDTYVTLLDNQFKVVASNDDDNDGLGGCSNKLQSFLKAPNLSTGYYYIVSEGYSQNGKITTTIRSKAVEPYIVNLGNKSTNFDQSHTQNTANTRNANSNRSTNEVFYKITLTAPMTLTAYHESSLTAGTIVSLLDSSLNPLEQKNILANKTDVGITSDILSPGEYYIMSEGRSANGNIKTRIIGRAATDVGAKSSGFNYSTTKTANDFYKVTLSRSMTLDISQCGTNLINTDIKIYKSDNNNKLSLISSKTFNSSINKCSTTANLKTNDLVAGIYYIYSGSKTESGNVKTTIIGTTPEPYIMNIGSRSDNFTFDYEAMPSKNAYEGRPTNDIYFKIELTTPMDLIVSHCGSKISETYIHLLNSSFNRITYADQNSGKGYCNSPGQAYLEIKNLAKGTYYIVSEGYTSNGIIRTYIEGRTNSPIRDVPETYNYIETRTPLTETSNINNLTIKNCMQTVQFFDGIGRLTQTLYSGMAPSGKHLLTLQEYDEFGREEKSWLPFPREGNAAYSPVLQHSYYAKEYYGDENPYTKITLEKSPLNRVLKTTGPGQRWHSANKGVAQEYTLNNPANEMVFHYYIGSNDRPAEHTNRIYDTGELYANKVTDEDGRITTTYINKLGQTVMQRQKDGNTNIDTYYVYDNRGNLRYVLPPLWGSSIDKYAYSYKYDNNNRCIEKKLPGADPIYYVYDKAGRLILSQDGNQRSSKKWTLTAYEKLGRVAYTAEVTLNETHAQLREAWKSKILIEEIFFSGSSNEMEDTNYTRKHLATAPARLLTVNYYDDYNFLIILPINPQQQLSYTNKSGYDTRHDKPRGLLTGTRIYDVTSGTNYSFTIYYYDHKGNIVQDATKNHRGGFEKNYYKRSFTGNIEKHQREIAGITEIYTYTYDHASRLKKVTHKLNSQAEVVIAQYLYDETGKVSSKSINNNQEFISYDYNIRGWTNEINSPNFQQSLAYDTYNGNITNYQWKVSKEKEGFSRKYTFDYDGLNRLTKAAYGEKGSSTYVANNNYTVTVDEYDKHGNIKKLTRRGPHKPSTADQSQVTTAPPTHPSIGVLDNLTFTYDGNQLIKVDDTAPYDPVYKGVMHFVDGSKATTEYKYDKNGNMIQDLNSQISNIDYNTLNLPSNIHISKDYGYVIQYNYDASGRKNKIKYYSDSRNALGIPPGSIGSGSSGSLVLQQEIDYVGNVIYKDGQVDKILIPDGYIDKDKSGKYIYHFYLKDYQGNNRVVIDQTNKVEQVNHYYPFGALFGASIDDSGQTYKYGDKELDRMFGLDWYDFEARMMNSILGRFMTMDPLCEIYYSISPYAYCANNPIRYIDPTGMYFDESNEKKAKKLEASINKQISRLEKKVDKGEKAKKDIGDLKDRIKELKNSKDDISKMRDNKETEFKYANASSKNNPAGKNKPAILPTGINEAGHNIITMYTENTIESQLHETRHGGQIAGNKYSFDSEGNPTAGYGINSEVDAYRAQYSYQGTLNYIDATDILNQKTAAGGVNPRTSTITDIKTITPNLVNRMGELVPSLYGKGYGIRFIYGGIK